MYGLRYGCLRSLQTRLTHAYGRGKGKGLHGCDRSNAMCTQEVIATKQELRGYDRNTLWSWEICLFAIGGHHRMCCFYCIPRGPTCFARTSVSVFFCRCRDTIIDIVSIVSRPPPKSACASRLLSIHSITEIHNILQDGHGSRCCTLGSNLHLPPGSDFQKCRLRWLHSGEQYVQLTQSETIK
jgi:hypothetical protein